MSTKVNPSKELEPGTMVRVQNVVTGEWRLKAKIIKRRENTQSYWIKDQFGDIKLRNKRLLERESEQADSQKPETKTDKQASPELEAHSYVPAGILSLPYKLQTTEPSDSAEPNYPSTDTTPSSTEHLRGNTSQENRGPAFNTRSRQRHGPSELSRNEHGGEQGGPEGFQRRVPGTGGSI